jgi:methionyl-tRNA formyltransferase
MRVIFMGSPDFATSTLKAILDAGHDVVCVYAQPPRPAGRGHKERPCPVHTAALKHGLQVRTPESMKDADAVSAFADLSADIAVVIAYGQILPGDVLSAPKHGSINVHASLLPRWRGAAPIQRAILAGDAESGVSIMQMDEGLDTGPVYLTRVAPIDTATTGGSLHDDLATRGAEACVQVLVDIEAGSITPQPQADDGVTYAAKISPADARIIWTQDAVTVERAVRAFDPWPRTWFEHDGERVKVLAAHVDENLSDASKPAGTVLDDRPAIACGNGVLVLDRLQRAGRKPQDAAEFMRGYDLKPGTGLV